MYQPLIDFYLKYFQDSSHDRYLLLKSSVCLSVCNMLYELFVREGDIVSIEKIPPKKKEVLWEITKKYQTEKEKRFVAAKALYALEAMTEGI